jgi:hypothetical protein
VGARQPGDPQCAGSAPAAEREIETAEIAGRSELWFFSGGAAIALTGILNLL